MKQFLKFKCIKPTGVIYFVLIQFFFSAFFSLIGSHQIKAIPYEVHFSFQKDRSNSEILNANQNLGLFTKIVQAPLDKDGQSASINCKKADFESVVDKAAGVLRDLNFKNKPHFQEKLKQLKEKRGWSDTVFEKEAIPFVKDEEIDRYDGQTLDLLAKITAMGDEGSAANVPDCALLEKLQTYMEDLIKTQTEKWVYMSQKIDTEMAKE